MKFERVGTITVRGVSFQIFGKIDNINGFKGALLYTDTATCQRRTNVPYKMLGAVVDVTDISKVFAPFRIQTTKTPDRAKIRTDTKRLRNKGNLAFDSNFDTELA
jgi:hypothetical protein